MNKKKSEEEVHLDGKTQYSESQINLSRIYFKSVRHSRVQESTPKLRSFKETSTGNNWGKKIPKKNRREKRVKRGIFFRETYPLPSKRMRFCKVKGRIEVVKAGRTLIKALIQPTFLDLNAAEPYHRQLPCLNLHARTHSHSNQN